MSEGDGIPNPNGENAPGPSGLHPGLEPGAIVPGSKADDCSGGTSTSARNRLSRSLWPPGIPYHGIVNLYSSSFPIHIKSTPILLEMIHLNINEENFEPSCHSLGNTFLYFVGPQQCPYCTRVLSNVGNWR